MNFDDFLDFFVAGSLLQLSPDALECGAVDLCNETIRNYYFLEFISMGWRQIRGYLQATCSGNQ